MSLTTNGTSLPSKGFCLAGLFSLWGVGEQVIG